MNHQNGISNMSFAMIHTCFVVSNRSATSGHIIKVEAQVIGFIQMAGISRERCFFSACTQNHSLA